MLKAREMAQLVKHLVCKHEAWVQTQSLCKDPGVEIEVCNPSAVEEEMGISVEIFGQGISEPPVPMTGTVSK